MSLFLLPPSKNKTLILRKITTDGTSAVVAAEATAGEFTISGSVQETNSSKYLNIQEADTSYKPLAFGANENFTGWDLEGDTLITAEASEYGRRKVFLKNLYHRPRQSRRV